jgi:Zn-dependent metalloprotease
MKNHPQHRLHNCRNPLHCFVPPHVLDEMSKSSDAQVRDTALKTIKVSAEARTKRVMLSMLPSLAATPSPDGRKHRLVYDMRTEEDPLPGKLVRSEGASAVGDTAVNEAYESTGTTYDFYSEILKRNSLDNAGMTLISSVHFGDAINNAFWDGEQMIYGDGDGKGFTGFTKGMDVIAHELTHGVIEFESRLIYRNESGALNESFADVMSALVLQWHLKQTVDQATWRMGEGIMGPATAARGLRTFKPEKAYVNDKVFGTDTQPKHLQDKFTGSFDKGGVHINSGIPNCAFYNVAMALGGRSWEVAGRIWYQTLRNLNPGSGFQECAQETYKVAVDYGSNAAKAVADGWKAVGITVKTSSPA